MCVCACMHVCHMKHFPMNEHFCGSFVGGTGLKERWRSLKFFRCSTLQSARGSCQIKALTTSINMLCNVWEPTSTWPPLNFHSWTQMLFLPVRLIWARECGCIRMLRKRRKLVLFEFYGRLIVVESGISKGSIKKKTWLLIRSANLQVGMC